MRPKIVFLSLYDCDRAYGGPEEGGWWYDTYQHIKSFPVLDDENLEWHKKAAHRLATYLNWRDDRRYPISSVLSKGQYDVIVEEIPTEFQTTSIPHYE